jgi:superfamily II DNA helicase RecQ
MSFLLTTIYYVIARDRTCWSNWSSVICYIIYNNSDIGNNKKHIEESMKNYCRSEDTCLRQQLLDYFGFSITKESKCCSVCDEE